MTEQDQPALSVVGYGLVAWLTDHGPATDRDIADHFWEANGLATMTDHDIVQAHLRDLEKVGCVQRLASPPHLWAAVAQPATTIHIQRPTEKPL